MKTANITSGDGYRMVTFDDESTINICPGGNRPSEITFMFDKSDKTLSFTATFFNKETLLSNCNPTRDGEINLYIKENGVVIKTIYLTHRKDENFTIDVTDKKEITLNVDRGKNEDYCDWFRLMNFKIE